MKMKKEKNGAKIDMLAQIYAHHAAVFAELYALLLSLFAALYQQREYALYHGAVYRLSNVAERAQGGRLHKYRLRVAVGVACYENYLYFRLHAAHHIRKLYPVHVKPQLYIHKEYIAADMPAFQQLLHLLRLFKAAE